MDLINAMLLGLVQGLTEFLPVSSSGHLVLFSELLGFRESGIAFEVFVHFGTLLSVLLAFRKEIGEMISAPFRYREAARNPQIKEALNWDFFIILATIPAVIVGLFFKDQIEAAFDSPILAISLLSITGILMVSTQFLKNSDHPFTAGRTFLMGVAQAVAILPGISRSGSTIFTGIAGGMKPERVARFSFLMSIPAILGAVVLKLNDLLQTPPTSDEVSGLIAGTLVAFVSGYFSIIWLLEYVKRGRLQWFGYYCLIVSWVGIAWHLWG